jgi:aspartate aminotransferase-like enzyme
VISKPINFSTGALRLPREVRKTFFENPVAHRSPEFNYLLNKTSDLFKEKFRVKHFYLLSGSGTLANEAMIQQIKMLNQKGLILSNGEFGNRLIHQAEISQLDFIRYTEPPGRKFDPDIISEKFNDKQLHWILFCHCETSTGIINDLHSISRLCIRNQVKCFVDCISTVGVMDIDLSGLTMAAASSGKGLCGLPGLAMVMSNIEVCSDGTIPVYLDLKNYRRNEGIPFTLSSVLLKALWAGSCLKLDSASFERSAVFADEIKRILKMYDLLPYDNFHVFTLMPRRWEARKLGERLKTYDLISSYQSGYLLKENQLQIALFGYYDDQEQRWGINRLRLVFEEIISNRLNIKGHFFEIVMESILNRSRPKSSII